MTNTIHPSTRSTHIPVVRIPDPAARYLVEAVGTFFLVFTIGASVRGGSALAPLAIGAVLMAMIYAGGHISGAHYNPAVTLAVLVRGRIDFRGAAGYWVSQIAGGLAAAAAVGAVVPAPQGNSLQLTGHLMVAAFIAELLVTFALCYVVLNVATSKDHPDNNFYGLAIGFTVLAGAVSVGGVSGGAFNPAVVFAGAAMGMFAGPTLWIYLAAHAVAALAAGGVFRLLNPDDK